VTDNALGHAAKKILCAGIRGAKDQAKDVQEAIDTLTRWQEMQAENHIVESNEMVHKPGSLSEFIQNAIDKIEEWEDKELPSSGIYGENGYTEDDLKAASLVHDCEPVESHWIEHTGNDCPVSDEEAILIVKGNGWENENGYPAGEYTWGKCLQGSITHWRYAK
jgi:hypothetical protein